MHEEPDSPSRSAQPLPSITELPNPLTHNMDLADADGIVRLLRQTDAQIINGYQDFPAIADRGMLDTLSECVDRILEMLNRPGASRVVISGAGTSGRLAMLASREINAMLSQRGRAPVARFTMAGGAAALVRAEEGAEDLPDRGVSDLQAAIGEATNLVYIGITCGMSAPYIAGQLDWAAERPNTFCILLGFSPLSRARRIPINGWGEKTFADVAERIATDPRHLVLTPIVGPEAITGSTRMKSGTATGIVLQLLIFCAFARMGVLRPEELGAVGYTQERNLDAMRRFLLQYETARNVAYLQSDHLAAFIEAGGRALKAGRHIYYLGSGNAGILGLIDASECPPTYGASFHDVRGFVDGGWGTILGPEGRAPEPRNPADSTLFRFDLTDFERDHLPGVQAGDLVIALGEGDLHERVVGMLAQCRQRGATTGAISIIRPGFKRSRWIDAEIFCPLSLPVPSYVENGTAFAEMSTKLILNGITTGAHILKGKVYRNYMVDLRITNSKLYIRAVGIVARLMEVSNQHAEAALLSSIYETDQLQPQHLQAPLSDHVAAATGKERIVPTAMLLATGRFSLQEARQALEKEPIVRQLLVSYIPQGGDL